MKTLYQITQQEFDVILKAVESVFDVVGEEDFVMCKAKETGHFSTGMSFKTFKEQLASEFIIKD